jgi:LacI family transcriptional regulator
MKKTRRNRSILLALGWNVHEFNLGVAEYARKANWILNDIMCHSGRLPSKWSGDGIITHVNSASERDLLSLLRKAKVPVVNLGAYRAKPVTARVVSDNAAIGRLAAEHLISRGFEHFAFCRLTSREVVLERMEGFRKAVESAGRQFHDLNFEERLVSGRKAAFNYDAVLPWMARHLKALPKPLGAMAQYDGEANDVVRACQMAGLAVPEQVAVIGVDNDPIYSQLGPVPLTSVDSNRRLAGYKAAELLDRILAGENWVEKNTLIEPEGVVVRESTDIVAVADPHVSKALRFIWQNYARDISVDEIVRCSGISRRGLYSRFETIVGHGIYDEIIRQRMNRAKQMLRETNEKLQFIADECGFETAERLSRSFKRFGGISPSDYRLQHQTD